MLYEITTPTTDSIIENSFVKGSRSELQTLVFAFFIFYLQSLYYWLTDLFSKMEDFFTCNSNEYL